MAIDEPLHLSDLGPVIRGPMQLVRELPAVAQSAGVARQLIAEALEEQPLARERCEDVVLAVSEAVTNAIRHAYRGTPGLITLSLRCTGGQLRIAVTDQGHGFGTPTLSPGLGLGMELIRTVADDVVFAASPDGGTIVEMRFAL